FPSRQVPPRDLPKRWVKKLHQLIECGNIASLPCLQHRSDVALALTRHVVASYQKNLAIRYLFRSRFAEHQIGGSCLNENQSFRQTDVPSRLGVYFPSFACAGDGNYSRQRAKRTPRAPHCEGLRNVLG